MDWFKYIYTLFPYPPDTPIHISLSPSGDINNWHTVLQEKNCYIMNSPTFKSTDHSLLMAAHCENTNGSDYWFMCKTKDDRKTYQCPSDVKPSVFKGDINPFSFGLY